MEQVSKLFILGESGSGKTSSLRNLDPKVTALLNIDRKALPLAGWRKKYVRVTKESTKTPGKIVTDFEKSNYLETGKFKEILTTMEEWEKRKDLETIVLDTITHMVTSDYMVSALGQDYAGYQAMGGHFYTIMDFIRTSRKNYIAFGHTETVVNEAGNVVVKMRSYGKMIDNMVPPSFFTTVLMTEIERTKDEDVKYQFRTQAKGNDPAKSPAVFDKDDKATPALDYYVPNDCQLVLDILRKFEN